MLILAKFPWNLSGGGAGDVVGMLESKGKSLTGFVSDIGMTILTLEDDVYVFPRNLGSRLRLADLCSNLVIGNEVRDYQLAAGDSVLMPQRLSGHKLNLTIAAERYLWPFRAKLACRLYFGQTPEERGMRWFDVGMFFRSDILRGCQSLSRSWLHIIILF